MKNISMDHILSPASQAIIVLLMSVFFLFLCYYSNSEFTSFFFLKYLILVIEHKHLKFWDRLDLIWLLPLKAF